MRVVVARAYTFRGFLFESTSTAPHFSLRNYGVRARDAGDPGIVRSGVPGVASARARWWARLSNTNALRPRPPVRLRR